MLNPTSNIQELSNKDYERYSRNIAIEEINIIGQKRLKSSKIICVGAGGLGSPAILYLTSCGIGTIGIIDDDIVEISNLQRQIIYNTKDIYNSKVKQAKINLTQINPLINIKIYNFKLSSDNIKSIFSEYDIIIDSTDNLIIRKLISTYCYQLHKIHVYGAIEKFTGYVSIFNYQNGPNYLDLYSNMDNINTRTCNTIGVLNTIAGIIGMIQATEVIKIVTGLGSILSGYLLKVDLINLTFRKIKIKRTKIKLNAIIESNSTNNSIQYIRLQKILNDNNYKILDIRDNTEFNIKHINNAINIPLHNLKQINYINYLKQKFGQYTLVLYCNNELRSLIGAQILNQHGINNKILSQGIRKIKK